METAAVYSSDSPHARHPLHPNDGLTRPSVRAPDASIRSAFRRTGIYDPPHNKRKPMGMPMRRHQPFDRKYQAVDPGGFTAVVVAAGATAPAPATAVAQGVGYGQCFLLRHHLRLRLLVGQDQGHEEENRTSPLQTCVRHRTQADRLPLALELAKLWRNRRRSKKVAGQLQEYLYWKAWSPLETMTAVSKTPQARSNKTARNRVGWWAVVTMKAGQSRYLTGALRTDWPLRYHYAFARD